MSQDVSGIAAFAVPSPSSIVRLVQAFDFAARAHVDQPRKGVREEPYINHLTEVAYLVAEATGGQDPDLVIAAVLHDSLEDQPDKVTYDLLAQTFGLDVASLVAEVTDDKSLPKAERKRLQIETAPSKSDRAKILKLADKTANLHALATSPPADWSDERKREYVQWSSRVVDGCQGVNPWLEARYREALKALSETPGLGIQIAPTHPDNILQGTLDDAVEGKPIEVGGYIHQLPDRQSLAVRSAFEYSVRPRQIRAVVEQLRSKGSDASWMTFMFYTPKVSTETDDTCLNLQYSIQDGVTGLDWVLLGERNIVDKGLLIDFIEGKGHTVTELELNDVRYLRVEDGDISGLGQKIVEELYGMTSDADIGVLVKGFSLSQAINFTT